jgi:hypothetical protein
MAAGEVKRSVSSFETEVTFTLTNCSKVKLSKSPADFEGWLVSVASAKVAIHRNAGTAPDKIHF